VSSRFLLVALALGAVSSACGTTPVSPSDPPTASELRSTPTTIVVTGKTLALHASLWRDFMPISPPDGRPLIAAVRVHAADGSSVPSSISVMTVWVLFNESIWSAPAGEGRFGVDTAPFYEVVARDGPKWGPGVNVDVVVRVTQGGRSWLLRAAGQPIVGTF
jgi:hypothetical protein